MDNRHVRVLKPFFDCELALTSFLQPALTKKSTRGSTVSRTSFTLLVFFAWHHVADGFSSWGICQRWHSFKYSIVRMLAKGHFYSSMFLQGLSFFIGACPQLPPTIPPMSCVSITGNNRPSSFITSWRWFPRGAAGSLWCQPASPLQQGARQRQ